MANKGGDEGAPLTITQIPIRAIPGAVGNFTAPAVAQVQTPVAKSPTGGQGVALEANGALPVGTVLVGATKRLIADVNGSSDFLQLLTQAKRKITFGSGTVTYPGGTAVAGATVTHGLGSTPFVTATSVQTSGGSATSAYLANVGATTFTVNVYSPTGNPTNGTTADFYWFAIV